MPTQPRNTLLLATDPQNSVLNAVGVTGVDAIPYTVYGHSPLDASQSRLRFNGEFQELMTGYYPLGQGYRMYSSILMRFISPDSPLFSPFGKGGLSPYMYCGGDPRNNTDPTGHWYKAVGKFLGLRPNAASNKAAKINSVLNRNPKNYKNSATSFFHNAASADASLGDPWVGVIRARARDNKLYLTRFAKNDAFQFQTETPIKLHKNRIIESTERLVSVSTVAVKPGHSEYLTDIQSALSKSKKGLTTSQLNNIKHEATKIRQINDAYKLSDLRNRVQPRRLGDPSRRDSNYWADR